MADASPLLPPPAAKPGATATAARYYARCASSAHDELRSFRACLAWLCVDHSSSPRLAAAGSWAVFLLLAVAAPAAVRLFLAFTDDSAGPFDAQVQVSLTLAAALAYVSLRALLRRAGGLRRLLYLDSLRRDSDDVQVGYAAQLARSFRVLACFVLPCALAEAAYKAYWFWSSWSSSSSSLPELVILRMVGFAREFGRFADVATVLQHHRRIRDQLRKISHRYRRFIVCSLVLVSASQFAALLATTRPHAVVNLATAGELALCSLSLVAGLLVCLHSAAKITHKTQAMTSVAAAWHADATVHAFDNDQENPEYPDLPPTAGYLAPANAYRVAAGDESGTDGDDDDDGRSDTSSSLDDPKYVPFQANNISFQKRQALVTYLENNGAGITVYGFVVDRAWLHALFMIEFSLVMWLLGKTVGIS
ncbi:hypothetical protein U9M48_023074 [Paspalum notatum var. saurae]|uniref:Uncharacterized protein n=1 Tax=Paspalum notatum var. saurae TaxID=547442 RepID=A0AAQ3WVS5_PASNO